MCVNKQKRCVMNVSLRRTNNNVCNLLKNTTFVLNNTALNQLNFLDKKDFLVVKKLRNDQHYDIFNLFHFILLKNSDIY